MFRSNSWFKTTGFLARVGSIWFCEKELCWAHHSTYSIFSSNSINKSFSSGYEYDLKRIVVNVTFWEIILCNKIATQIKIIPGAIITFSIFNFIIQWEFSIYLIEFH